jgi:hypothetical protein
MANPKSDDRATGAAIWVAPVVRPLLLDWVEPEVRALEVWETAFSSGHGHDGAFGVPTASQDCTLS